jgi:iron(III) transport system substrate-binding protein
MRRLRIVSRAAVAAGTVLVLTACGGNPTSPSSSGGGGGDDNGPTEAEQLYEDMADLSGQERRDKLVEQATEEGSLTLYTSMTADVADAVSEAFTDEFDIDVNLYRAASETVLQRILQEQDAGFAGNDVVETNATELLDLQQEGLMAPCIAQELVDKVPDAGQFDDWTATRFNLFAPSWNTNLISGDMIPKSWEDLADPKYDGTLSMELGDYDWYLTLYSYWLDHGKSEDEINKLFQDMVDGAKLVKGHTVQAELMTAGEFGVTASNYTYIVERAKQDGAPVAYEPLVSPVIARPNGGSCMKTAEHPAAAMLFMDWLLDEGQKVITDLGLTPAVQEEGALGDVELIPVDTEKLLNEGDEWSKRYDDLLANGEIISD